MGAWNMKMVMDCLDGADVAIPNWKPKKYGAGRIRRLDTYDLALLLAVAYRQKDEVPGESPDDCLCYGGEELLSRITRMGTTKLEDCRDFLTAASLVTYAKSATCPKSLRHKIRKGTLDYVWRLNKAGLFALKNPGGEVAETPPRGLDEPATRGDQARHAGTKNTYNKTNNSSMSAADLKDADKKRAETYLGYIVQKYGLSSEQRQQIGIEGIVAGTAGKRPDDVKRTIDGFGQTDMLERKFGTWVGILVKRLKELPKADDPSAIPAADKLEAQFSAPKKVVKPIDYQAMIKDCWARLYKGLGLAELPQEKCDELKNRFHDVTARVRKDSLADFLCRIVDDVPYERGKYDSFETMRTVMPNVNDRADKFKAELQSCACAYC